MNDTETADIYISPNGRDESLRPQDFVKVAGTEADRQLRAGGCAVQAKARGRLYQFWTGSDSRNHYEIALHERFDQLEIGFHLEATPDENAALYHLFEPCLLEIQSVLGSQFWLEEWDRGWVRLYETQPLGTLTPQRANAVAERLVHIYRTLQPIYESFAGALPTDS